MKNFTIELRDLKASLKGELTMTQDALGFLEDSIELAANCKFAEIAMQSMIDNLLAKLTLSSMHRSIFLAGHHIRHKFSFTRLEGEFVQMALVSYKENGLDLEGEDLTDDQNDTIDMVWEKIQATIN